MDIQAAVNLFGSQTKLAAAMGVSRQAVQKWVVAGRIPELRQYKLREFLGRRPKRA